MADFHEELRFEFMLDLAFHHGDNGHAYLKDVAEICPMAFNAVMVSV